MTKVIAGYHELARLNKRAIREHRQHVLSDKGLKAARRDGDWNQYPVTLAVIKTDEVRLRLRLNTAGDIAELDVSLVEYGKLGDHAHQGD